MSRLRRERVGRPGAVAGMLAMLGLVLVGPIHHLHAIARDFGAAHHADAAIQPDCHEEHVGHGGTPPAKQPTKAPIYCPVCTLGKMAAALLPPSLPALAVPLVLGDAPLAVATAMPDSLRPAGIARPRAPPVEA